MVKSKAAPSWARAYLATYREPGELELAERRVAIERALKIRERLIIAPLTTGELNRSLRLGE